MNARRAPWFGALLLIPCLAAFAQQAKTTAVRAVPDQIDDRDAEHDDPYGRDQWLLEGRTAKGESPAALRYRAYREKVANRSASQPASSNQTAIHSSVQTSGAVAGGTGPAWQSLGPAPIISSAGQSYGAVAGRLTSVVIDQGDKTGNTVYIGAAYGGLWKSTNAAATDPAAVTWTPLIEDQPTLAVGALALQPGNSNVILVGTGEANNSGDSYYGLGILRSTDSGATWTLIGSADGGTKPLKGLAFSKFAFSTADPNLVVATTASAGRILGADSNANTTKGIYYSSDAGQTWHYATVNEAGTTISGSSSYSVVYNAAEKKFFAFIRAHGIYASSDGQTWTKTAAQPPPITPTSCPVATNLNTCTPYRGELAVRAGSDEMYLWMVQFGGSDLGIFKTTDGGATWTRMSETGITSCGDPVSAGEAGCGATQGDYNLYLAAVPNGSGTDLYGGAVNIFKCSITSADPTCAAPGWMNLTHVYGCSQTAAPAHVHPDQHGIDFVAGNPQIAYFAGDGGVYRTTNAAGLNSGACAAHNPFDNLNGNLGSVTEFVSFSQDPGDDGTLLGGTQDNGSPSLFRGSPVNTNGTTWNQANGGDGGFNEIDPNATSTWYTALPHVNIQRCTAGTACDDTSFAGVIGSSNVGGDTSAFYMPWLLDPRNTTNAILGTCRVWRGPADGGGTFTQVSANLSAPGNTAACTTADDMIRALGAGGAIGGSGSQVIYAGTAGGRIFVTTSAGAGPSTWVERTGGINPSHYVISSIFVDPNDNTGSTAYITIMGFGTNHVFKTTDAGGSWTPFDPSGSGLPDAPADSVVIDPINRKIVYVGTDVGVFFTSNGGQTWQEYGSGLPNVPISKLRTFNNCSTRKFLLRASTYGRGVWQVPLASVPATSDYSLLANPSTVTVFPGQVGAFKTIAQAFNGYASNVQVSCSGGNVPSSCQAQVVTPNACGTTFTVNASDTRAQDFTFNLQGVGQDPAASTHTEPVTLHVVDFGLIGSSAPVTAPLGVSTDFFLAVQSLNSFSGSVNLSCNVPSGMTCTVPSPVALGPGTNAIEPAKVTVPANLPTGSYTMSVIGSTAGGPSHTQNYVLNVVTPTFLFTGSPSVSVFPSTSATTQFTVVPVGGFTDTITLSCGNLPAGATCSLSPSTVKFADATTPVSVTATVTAAATTPTGFVQATITGTAPSYTTTTKMAVVVASPRFTIAGPITTLVSVVPGGSGSATFTVAPSGPFVDTISFACEFQPAGASCAFSPASVKFADATTPVTVTVTVSTATNTPLGGPTGITVHANAASYSTYTYLNLSLFDYTVTPPASSSQTVRAGSAASYTLQLGLVNGSGPSETATVTSTGCPSLATCTISPSGTVAIPSAVTLTVTTAAPGAAQPGSPLAMWIMNLPIVGMIGAGFASGSRKRRIAMALAMVAVAMLLATTQIGCGGGSGSTPSTVTNSSKSPGTPSGTYTLTVTATSGTTQRSTNVTLIVQ